MKILVPLFLAFLFCINTTGYSQRKDRCGTKTPALPYLIDSITKARVNARALAGEPYMIKLFVHIIANNDGTGRAVADTTMMRQLRNMQQFYAPQNICFILMGMEQINSSDLNSHNSDTEQGELSSHVIGGVVNIFVHNSLFDNDGGLNGVAFDIPATSFCLDADAVESIDNRSTTAHEMGHCFGLYHTFSTTYGEENIDRSGQCTNCFLTGDLLCDTEADPHSDTNDTGNDINEDCEYSDNTQSQICGGTRLFYRMDPHNIMAYGRRPCRDVFTNGQGGRARSTIEQYIPLVATMAIDGTLTLTSSDSYTSGRPMYAAKGAITINAASFVGSNSARAVFASRNLVDVKGNAQFLPTGNGSTDFKASALCQ
jgi:hypothetical protein